MRIAHAFVVALLVALGGCAVGNKASDFQVINGTCMISAYEVKAEKGSVVRMGGKVFRVTKSTISWDGGKPVGLMAGWGLMELVETPKGVDVNLDGAKIGEAGN